MLRLGFWRLAALAPLFALVFAACSLSPSAPEKLTPELTAQLEQRVRDRWQTLADREFGETWEFSTPNFKEVFPKHLFVRGFSYGVEWELTGVEILNYDGRAAVASVAARVMSKPVKPISHASASMGAIPTTINESWIFIDGQWWYSSRD